MPSWRVRDGDVFRKMPVQPDEDGKGTLMGTPNREPQKRTRNATGSVMSLLLLRLGGLSVKKHERNCEHMMLHIRIITPLHL